MMFRKKRGKSERKDKDIPTYVPPGPKGGGLEPEFRLQVKLTNIFREPLESTPVYKDLPRLAHRIEVSGHLPRREQPSGTEAKEANTFEVWIKVDLPVDEQQRNTVRYWGPNYQTGVLYVRDGARGRGIVLHLFDQQLGELQNEPFAMTSVSNVATVRDSTRYFVVEVPDYTTRTSVFLGIAFSSRPESAQFIKAIASAPLSRGSCINLHEVAIKEQWARLLNAAGVTTSDLQDPTTRELILSTVKQTLRAQRHAEPPQALGKLEQIREVVKSISERLENSDQHKLNMLKLDELVRSKFTGDMQLVMEDMFTQAIGVNSKTARVFKMIHQSVIFVPIIILKTTVTKDLITRDDNSPEGWRIPVTFNQDSITICHIRRELPLAGAKADESQFWYEWQLKMTFDPEMLDLVSSELRVTHLHTGEGLNPKLKEVLQRVLHNGDLLVQAS
eukprot:TRINITY_DN5950_c0_g1_i2.p1 TRINITY_DN5950_c0_g1~~TRINITY_DN5950_c0_g1_i2.p1  ORF type:complete len:446 (+),score=51.80 TRINITY_DN5950_c0_g1_i2:182-1519(+)